VGNCGLPHLRRTVERAGLLALLVTVFAFPDVASGQGTGAVVLEDYSDAVTAADLGFNDFSGSTGTINKDDRDYGRTRLVRSASGAHALRFEWDFSIGSDSEAFTGLFHALFGSTRAQVTEDGSTTRFISFPRHVLDLDAIDAPLAEPGGPRGVRALRLALVYTGGAELKLRLELKDVDGRGRFTRFALTGSPERRVLTWDFRNPASYGQIGAPMDLHRAKELVLLVERNHVGDGVSNPTSGALDIESIAFDVDRPELEPADDDALLDLLERRSCQYFLDWSSREPAAEGMPQDRSTFGDLLTVGGVGFALPAYAICAQRGWIPRDEAARRTLSVLELLANGSLFGAARTGTIGHRGWLYHFLGHDGRRKLNFDRPETQIDEARNTVELSSIDTGLALMGVLAAQSLFDSFDPVERDIRLLAQRVYDRVDWPFMLEPATRQFYLGWKPNENFDPGLGRFDRPDAAGEGVYSTKGDGSPLTLDFYTDEAAIVTLLAAGSTTHPVARAVHCSWIANPSGGFVRTYPGALFTYQFLHAFLDTRGLKHRVCRGEEPVDWYENSRLATLATIAYAEANPAARPTYGPDAWGLNAAEGPDNAYRAYAAPPAALDTAVAEREDGTITYYGMVSALTFGDDLRARAIRALRRAWQRGHWHPRFALPDAFNDDVQNALLDERVPWVNRPGFAIDVGPMLLHLENARSGLVWRALARNANIRRALDRLIPPAVEQLSMVRKRFPVGRRSGFRYRLSEAAAVRIAIEQRVRRRKAACRSSNRPSCFRYVRRGTLRHSGRRGRNRHAFSGRIGRRALRPGRYRATLTATDSFGNRSEAATVGFRLSTSS
jgi:hypothetical protein